MKKVMIIVLALMVFASMAIAQTTGGPTPTKGRGPVATPVDGSGNPITAPTGNVAKLAAGSNYADGNNGFVTGSYTQGNGIPLIVDKLGPHQNGGRGCAGCHAPHSGVRGNGGTMKWDDTAKAFVSEAATGDVGNETLWGQDLEALATGYAAGIGTGWNSKTKAPFVQAFDATTLTNHAPIESGIMMCLSCHDGNVATGAMMTNTALEPSLAGFPAQNYGGQPIPTLLGNDGGTAGNYKNDHPIGTTATLSALGSGISSYFVINAAKTNLASAGAAAPDAAYDTFVLNYTNAVSMGSRAGQGFQIDSTVTTPGAAYVTCTSCHGPHSMYVFSGTAANVAGKYPTFFFLNGPYNPGADTAGGYKASSATQFCRSCHFKGAGGSNEGSGISIPTAF